MATKVTPKQTVKTSAKTSPDPKAKAIADREKLIAECAGEGSEILVAGREAQQKSDKSLINFRAFVLDKISENELTPDEAVKLIRVAVAEAYDCEATDLKGKPEPAHRNAYIVVSRIRKLVFPTDAKAGKELEKLIAADEYTIADALEVARGNIKANQAKVSKGKGKNAAGNKAKAEDMTDDQLVEQFIAVIKKGQKANFDDDEISDAFAKALAFFEEKDGEETDEASE